MALKFLIDLLTGNLVLVQIPSASAGITTGFLLEDGTSFLLTETGDFLLQEA